MLSVSGQKFCADASDFGCKASLEAFGSILGHTAGIAATVKDGGRGPQLADGKKRLQRAKMLHAVITQKFPDTEAIASLQNIRKMSVEWLHGMLDVTFALEASMIAENFENSAVRPYQHI
jgi:hypothetical protein